MILDLSTAFRELRKRYFLHVCYTFLASVTAGPKIPLGIGGVNVEDEIVQVFY